VRLLIIIIVLFIIGCNSGENQSANNKPENTIHKEEKLKEIELQDGDLIFHTSIKVKRFK